MPQLPDPTLAHLNDRLGTVPAIEALRATLQRYPGRVAVISSFGAEAAVLLHMVAQVDAALPVLMLDTELLFPETLAYQADLSARLGLTDVRRIRPQTTQDADHSLHRRDTDACCALRKRAPMRRALTGFEAVVTGRKRFQTGARAQMQRFERDPEGRVRLNPLDAWGPDEIAAYFDRHDLPRHPLVARGYPSIGCWPCTSAVATGEDPRAGRWRGEDREECGIHFDETGALQRRAI